MKMRKISRRHFVKESLAAGVAMAMARTATGSSSKHRVAVIGRTGRGNYGHNLGQAWLKVKNATIIAVADEDDEGRAKAVKRLGARKAYADYREMLEKERPEIVTVAPRYLDCHHEMVMACAEAGAHVFMEKPFSRDLEEADEMVSAMEKKGLKLAVAHERHHSPTMQTILKIVSEGRLGDVLELRGRGKEDKRGAGHDMMNLGSHTFDLMRMIAGDPKWCFAEVLKNGHAITKADVGQGREGYGPVAGDEINAMYRFDGKTVGYFASHRARHGSGDRWGIHVIGSKGIITIGQGGDKPRSSWFVDDPTWQPGRSKAKWQQITSAGVGVPEPIEGDVESHERGNHRLVVDLVRAIETNTQPKVSMYDGRWTIEMMMAVHESSRLKRRVAMPLKNRRHPLTMI
jgi:predicted dehydrogenase